MKRSFKRQGLEITTAPYIDLNKLVLKTVKIYNRYRSPEATARLLKLDRQSFTIEFCGTFCQSCGVHDYFEDFIYELWNLSNSSVEVEIREIEQTSTQSFKVLYKIKGVNQLNQLVPDFI
jgi:hypothetical protein